MSYYPEKDPVLNAAERRLYIVVDAAVENLAKVAPAVESVPRVLPEGVADLDMYRLQKQQETELPLRTVSNIVNLEEKRQAAGVTAHERLMTDAYQAINQQHDESQPDNQRLQDAA